MPGRAARMNREAPNGANPSRRNDAGRAKAARTRPRSRVAPAVPRSAITNSIVRTPRHVWTAASNVAACAANGTPAPSGRLMAAGGGAQAVSAVAAKSAKRTHVAGRRARRAREAM